MATIRKRSNKWHAQVRRVGHPSQSKSFLTKPDAQKWARQLESQLDNAIHTFDAQILDQTTVADLLVRYRETVTVTKRGVQSENKRVEVFLRYDWADKPLSKVTAQTFAQFRDARLKQVRPATVVRELGILRSVFETARNEWDIPLPENPLIKVRKPKQPDARNRRLLDGELNKLLDACKACRNDWLLQCILFAIETGMRRGEILNIRWCDIDLDNSLLTIPITKNGHSRCIPLTSQAVSILKSRSNNRREPKDLVFDTTANAFRLAWERCKRRVAIAYPEISDLRFHDLRHEAVSRFFEMGLSVPEVALISGHRDPRMLFKYTHLKPQDIVSKLQLADQSSINGGV